MSILEKWNPEKRFILAIHRYGNSLNGLQETEDLREKLKTRNDLLVACELDLKWLETKKYIYYYLYHGFVIPETNYDIIKTEKSLMKKVKEKKIILLEDALQKYKDLYYMVHVKNGIGNIEFAMEKMAEMFAKYKCSDKYFCFANSLETVKSTKKILPEIPIGSVHLCRLKGRWLHLADYQTFKMGLRHGFWLANDEISTDYLIATEKNIQKQNGQIKLPYISHAVKTKKELDLARKNGAIGAFIYLTPKELLKIL